jgi:hypothetical protein
MVGHEGMDGPPAGFGGGDMPTLPPPYWGSAQQISDIMSGNWNRTLGFPTMDDAINPVMSLKPNVGDCMKRNAHWYSTVGVIDLVAGTNWSDTWWGNAIGGNDVTGAAFVFVGDDENGSESLGTAIYTGAQKGVVGGIGKNLMKGGNKGNVFQTLIQKRGRPSQVLARSARFRKLLKMAHALAELKEAVDLGLSGALAVNCALGQIN